jgi:MFS family permease
MSFMPNLLATRRGRLTAFFFLYVAEGIPLGFTATAIATQLRRGGVTPAQIGAFIGVLYLPWGWKWAMGPIVDLVYSDRLGRRRLWIMAAQLGMVLSLLSIMNVRIDPSHLRLFFIAAIVLNVFSAVQDVAIDALAVGSLRKAERGLANGLMFSGAYTGQIVGGSGVLFLNDYLKNFDSSLRDFYSQGSFSVTFLVVASALMAIMILVSRSLREPRAEEKRQYDGSPLAAVWRELVAYVVQAVRAFFGSRAAVAAFVLALMPIGTYSLSLALQANLAVEIGMEDSDIATLGLITAIIAAVCCVIGGLLSDKLGRRRMLTYYVLGTTIPPLILLYVMLHHDWILPIDPTDPARRLAPASLVRAFWMIAMVHATFTGLVYGTRTAIFMDVCDPKVAATQFTAYMALLNVVISYSAIWQGLVIEKHGYPMTLGLDVIVGMLCLAVLPFVKPRPSADPPAISTSDNDPQDT